LLINTNENSAKWMPSLTFLPYETRFDLMLLRIRIHPLQQE